MMTVLLALLGLLILLGAAVLVVVRLTRWLAARAAERLLPDDLDTGLAIPMRDCDTRRTPRQPKEHQAEHEQPVTVEKLTTLQ